MILPAREGYIKRLSLNHRTQKFMWLQVSSVAIGGAVGALARWGLSSVVARFASGGFPWPTITVNALGCLLCGMFFAGLEAAYPAALRWKWAALTGFLGAFTTFSAFALETFALARSSHGLSLAIAYMVLQNALGIALFAGGYFWLRPQG